MSKSPTGLKVPRPKTTGDGTNLRAFLNTKKKTTRVIGAVERHVLTRPLDRSRATDVLHPSEIIKDDWCHRASWYLLNGRVLSDDDIKRAGGRLESIFEEGHYIHGKWQTWWSEMGVLYGVWEHNRTKAREWGVGPRPGWTYKEVPLVDPSLRISGHADGWLVNLPDGGEDLLPEIKSIGTGTIRYGNPSLLSDSLEESFNNIRRPFMDHIKQANIYGALLRRMKETRGLRDVLPEPPTKIVFIYECKANQQPKEFIAEMDEEMVREVLDQAEDLVAHLGDKAPVPCNIGGASGCPKCKPFEAAS